MKNKGIVSSSLLKFILREHVKEKMTQAGDEELLRKRDQAVRDLMIKFSFLVPMFDSIKEDDLLITDPLEYLVPSLFKPLNEGGKPVSSENAIFMVCSIKSPGTVVSKLSDIRERGFLPPGLFQRYVARILTEVDATRGGQSYDFSHKDQVCFSIGQTKITLTALQEMGTIRIDYLGEVIYGPLKLMEEIMGEVKTECFHKLEAITMVPFPPNANETQGLIRLDMLKMMENNFKFNEASYNIREVKAAYATLLQPNVLNQSFDVFISYKWGEEQKTIVRFLYSRLSRTLVQEENNRPLNVYLDEKENKIGDNFAHKFCSAFKGLKIFLPLVDNEALHRMRNHDPSTIDYVLAEWIIALSKQCKVLPILLEKNLNLAGLFDDLPEIYPKKTVGFVIEQLEIVGMEDCARRISCDLSSIIISVVVACRSRS